MAVIEVEALTKRYGRTTVVDDVSFTVGEGEVFGLLGPNGAGKSTTVECVCGLRSPDGGRVRVVGVDPARRHDVVREAVGVQLQEGALPDRMRVGEVLTLYASFYRAPRQVGDLLEALGLGEHLDAAWKTLSGGLKQRLALALALVGDPQVAVLDELTTGLDPAARRDVWALVRGVVDERGVSVLLVTHAMEEAEQLCDRAAVLDHGRIVALGTPAALVEGALPEQRLRFRPSEPLDLALLRALPEVTAVDETDAALVVTGREGVVGAVTTLLARNRVLAHGLRIDQPTLDDAVVALTREGR